MNVTQEAINYILETHIMFSPLPGPDKLFLRNAFETKTFSEGEVIAEQGTPMDGMYYFYAGKIRLKKMEKGKRKSLGLMEKEHSIGEQALIKEAEWPYQVVVEEAATVFVLAADKVRPLLDTNFEMAEIFKKEIGFLSLSQRLRGLLGSASYTSEQFSGILHGLGVKTIRRGKSVFQQGAEDPRLYLIESGSVALRRKPVTGDAVVLDTVPQDSLIGESGALLEADNRGTQPHAAVAMTDTTVLVIKQPEVQKIFTINPALQEKLRLRIKDLRQSEQDEVETRKRAEGVDQRVRLAEGVTEEEFKALDKKKEIRKFSLVRQRDESDCGAACLTMIANHYGKSFTMGQIRELSNLSMPEPTPNLLITGAEAMGFNASAYALTFEQLQQVKLPGIIGWEGYHYAVIYRITGKEVHIADPAGKNIQKIDRKKFEEGWTQAEVPGVTTGPNVGVFIGLAPTVKFEHAEPPKKPILHFVRYIWPYKRYFGDALVGALILNLLGLASPLFIQVIVDTVVVHKDVSLLNMMLGGMVLVAAFRTITTAAQSMLLAHTTARIDLRLMSEFYRHILSLPMSFFLTRNKGEILARFGENQKIRAIIAGSTITVVLSSLMIVVYLLMMFGYHGTLTSVALIFIPMYIAITLYFTPRIKAIAQKQFLTHSQSQSHLIESLNGIESLKATSNEYMARSRWEDAFVENVNMGFQSQKLALTSNSLNQLVNLGSQVAILWLGATFVMENELTIGGLMGFNMLMAQVMAPIQQMVGLWNNSQDVRIAIDRVSEVLNVKPEQEPITSPEAMPAQLEHCRGEISFENANFSYIANKKENHIMKDFNLVIQPGEHVGFVGASGCGKSTVAKCVLGFNIVNGGHVRIDGKDVRDLDLSSLRRNIGVVLQDSFLFAGTVAENIALGDPEPDMVAVKSAARLAGADDFIVNYPLGYQTLIGEKGMGISGGQRQRVCIARALYRRPKIMIFDEATSALDNESEARIQKNMKDILAGRTSITIAHRLSTLVDSDYICYIGGGKVAEKGSHEQLIDPDYLREKEYTGLYYKLAQSQFDLPPLKF